MAATIAKRRRKLRPGDVIFRLINGLIMISTIVVMIYPFWNTIAISFNDAQDTLRGGITLFPRVFSTYSYETVFKNDLMLTAAVNSVLRTLISTILYSKYLKGFLGQLPRRYEAAQGPNKLGAVLFTIDTQSKGCCQVTRVDVTD